MTGSMGFYILHLEFWNILKFSKYKDFLNEIKWYKADSWFGNHCWPPDVKLLHRKLALLLLSKTVAWNKYFDEMFDWIESFSKNYHLHYLHWLIPPPKICYHVYPLELSSCLRMRFPQKQKVNKRCIIEWKLLWATGAQTCWLFAERTFPPRNEEAEAFISQ